MKSILKLIVLSLIFTSAFAIDDAEQCGLPPKPDRFFFQYPTREVAYQVCERWLAPGCAEYYDLPDRLRGMIASIFKPPLQKNTLQAACERLEQSLYETQSDYDAQLSILIYIPDKEG